MVNRTLNTIINHLLKQNSWAQQMLAPWAMKRFMITSGIFEKKLLINPDGSVQVDETTIEMDAKMILPPSVLIRLSLKDNKAVQDIIMEGNTSLAMQVLEVLAHLSWDYEEDLSHFIGDIAAHQLTQSLTQLGDKQQQFRKNFTAMLVEFLLEEKMLLAKKRNVHQFNTAVDQLREDVARLEKRIERLTQ